VPVDLSDTPLNAAPADNDPVGFLDTAAIPDPGAPEAAKLCELV
jgi:hypothetical protein